MKLLKIIATKIKNAYYLVFRNPMETQLRIRELKNQEEYEGSETLLSFQSYVDLKRYQKKVRLFIASVIFATIFTTISLIFAFILLMRFVISLF